MKNNFIKLIMVFIFSSHVVFLSTGCNSDFERLYDDPSTFDRAMENLVGWWNFESSSDVIIEDLSGYENNGSKQNFISNTSVAGKRGQALEFDGLNDYVDLGADLSILKGVSGATLAAWIKADSPTAISYPEGIIVGFSVNNPGSSTKSSRASLSIIEELDNYKVIAAGRTGGAAESLQKAITPAAAVYPGTWYHVAAVLDYANDLITIYVDGRKIISQKVNFPGRAAHKSVSSYSKIGSEEDGSFSCFNGIIDEVMIFNRALSEDEIKAVKNYF